MSASTIECATHGPQPETFVCQHIFISLDTKVAVGFHWSREDSGPFPDAWCSECEAARSAGDGEWNDELMKMVGVKLLCAGCYTNAKSIWLAVRREHIEPQQVIQPDVG
jgi:hypothetical protein